MESERLHHIGWQAMLETKSLSSVPGIIPFIKSDCTFYTGG
jgi:hypothetical protein